MVTTGSQKITVWGPGGTPLGILRVKVNKKTPNGLILLCIDTRNSSTCFSTLKFHHQGVNHVPAVIEIRDRWYLYVVSSDVMVRV
jgi:hypothetical protein